MCAGLGSQVRCWERHGPTNEGRRAASRFRLEVPVTISREVRPSTGTSPKQNGGYTYRTSTTLR